MKTKILFFCAVLFFAHQRFALPAVKDFSTKKAKIIMKAILILLLLIFATPEMVGQRVSITVVDENNEPLSATALIKGTNVTLWPSMFGTMDVNLPENAVLQFTRIGFHTKEVAVNRQPAITVVMTRLPSYEVSGTVVNEYNEPLINARVTAFMPAPTGGIGGIGVWTYTGTDGGYLINVPENAVLEFNLIGFHRKSVSVNQQQEINVVMTGFPTYEVSGTVVNENNEPLINAQVFASTPVPGKALESARTGTDGAFLINVPEEARLLFLHTGYQDKVVWVNQQQEINVVMARDERRIGGNLPPRTRITGSVTNERNEPMQGVYVAIMGRCLQGSTPRTLSDGSFAIDVSINAVLLFFADGYYTQDIAIDVDNLQEINVVMESR